MALVLFTFGKIANFLKEYFIGKFH